MSVDKIIRALDTAYDSCSANGPVGTAMRLGVRAAAVEMLELTPEYSEKNALIHWAENHAQKVPQ